MLNIRAIAINASSVKVDCMAISSGETTLNQPWLVGSFRALRALNLDPQARLHPHSNGTLLTPDHIDELVLEAGVTDIGVNRVFLGEGMPYKRELAGLDKVEAFGWRDSSRSEQQVDAFDGFSPSEAT